jgi:hypothetical protein
MGLIYYERIECANGRILYRRARASAGSIPDCCKPPKVI